MAKENGDRGSVFFIEFNHLFLSKAVLYLINNCLRGTTRERGSSWKDSPQGRC